MTRSGAEGNGLGLRHDLRSLLPRLALAAAIAFSGLMMDAETSTAHCPNTADLRYAFGYQDVTAATGVRGNIEYTNPTVCGGHAEPVSIEGFSLCRTNLCNDWLQVGWGKVLGYTMPKGYCEFNHVNGSLELVEWAMTAATHKFTVQYHRATGYWECFMDGVWKTANPVGFASGTYLNAQGEVRTVHTQIGRNAPGKLLFSNMSREFDDLSNGWTTFNVTLADPDSPYGNSEPQPGQFKNWTNAH